MSSLKSIHRGGLAAAVGGILGILISPFYALAYFATRDGAESLSAPWVAAWAGALRPVLEPFLTFASPETVYLTYGKLLTFVFLGWLAGLLALHGRQAASSGRLEKWGFRVALTGIVLGVIGSVGVYWVGAFSWGVVDFFFLAFMVPALVLFNAGFPLFGAGTLRAKVASRHGGWLLTVGGFPGIFLLTFLTGQIAPGLLMLNLAWVVIGYSLYSEKAAPVRQPLRAG